MRRKLTLIEVQSSFRASWDNHFADREGYPIAINELTDAFLYLASDQLSAYVTGQILEVNGGQLMP